MTKAEIVKRSLLTDDCLCTNRLLYIRIPHTDQSSSIATTMIQVPKSTSALFFYASDESLAWPPLVQLIRLVQLV